MLGLALVHKKFQYENSTELINRIDKELKINQIINVLEITYNVKIKKLPNRSEYLILNEDYYPIKYYGKLKRDSRYSDYDGGYSEDNLFKFEELYDYLDNRFPENKINL